MKVPRNMSYVKYLPNDEYDFGWTEVDRFVYLGEIVGMEEHCVVINMKTNKIISGIHIDRFVEVDEDTEF